MLFKNGNFRREKYFNVDNILPAHKMFEILVHILGENLQVLRSKDQTNIHFIL